MSSIPQGPRWIKLKSSGLRGASSLPDTKRQGAGDSPRDWVGWALGRDGNNSFLHPDTWDIEDLSLVTGCASEDTEVDSLGSEEDSEPPELYSGDVSCARRLRRLTALDTSPEYSSGGSSSSSSPSSSTSSSSSAHTVTRDASPGSHPVGPILYTPNSLSTGSLQSKS